MASSTTPSPASSPHMSMQYLSSLLSQRGPNALPYSEDVKQLIRQHLLNLTQEFSNLRAKRAPFVYNDGTTVHLLQAEGTIPMTFHGLTYNIPIIIWLLEGYPKAPPRVFVSPTKDMVIKRPHRYVDAAGMVSLPYLQSWFYPRSNLTELARNLSSMFGQDPPLYSKASSPSLQQRTNRPATGSASPTNPIRNPNPYTAGSAASSNSNPYTTSFLPSPSRPSGLQTQQIPPSPQRTEHPRLSGRSENPGSGRTENYRSGRTENPSEVFRRNTINSLVERLKLDASELRKTHEADMDKLVTTQSQLKQRKDLLKQGVEQIQREKEGLEQQLQIILNNTNALESWLKTHGKSHLEIDVDDAFEPCDALSKQMLDCSSADHALEDLLYSLDKAVQEGSVPVDVYLKQVRSLAREQFFHRATVAKVQAAQQQIQVSHMPARYVS